MPAQIFRRSANQLAHATLIFALLGAAGGLALAYLFDRSPYHTRQGTFVHQTVPFSHDHHTEGLGIDCRYCHTSVEQAAFAGIPPTQTCMNCHKQIWADAELLEPVRQSWATGQPLHWRRVNDLPDFVYFDHSIHVAKGIGCQSCHGQVNEMPLMVQAHSLQMGWCLDCHRHPERQVRPRDQVFNMKYEPGPAQREIGREKVEEYEIVAPDNCSACHR